MCFLSLAAVLLSSAYAAAVREQGCDAAVTKTIIPGPTTANREEQHYSGSTAAPSTTTVTRTVTYRQAATKTTAIAPACQATSNHGLFNRTINVDSRTASQQLPEVRTYSDMTIDDRCQACFTSNDGCMAWSFNGSVSNGDPVTGCSLSMVSNGCPTQQGTQMIMDHNDEKPRVGVGACGIEVQTF